MAEEAVGIVGQTTLNTLMGERRFFGASGSPCSGVRRAPSNQMEEAAVEDGAARGGDDGGSQAVGRGGQSLWSPKTAPESRQRRRGGRVGHARSTTADGRLARRRGALFGGEGDAAGDDGSRARAHVPPDAPERLDPAGDTLEQATALTDAAGVSAMWAISVGGGPTDAQAGIAVDLMLGGARLGSQAPRWYALVRAMESRSAPNASQRRATAQIDAGDDAPARLAAARAAEAGRAAVVARSAEPPTATDAPT